MSPTFRPTPGAKGYQHSCTPVLSSIALLATLELIDKVGFGNMVQKGRRLTDEMERLLKASRFYIPPSTSFTNSSSPSSAEIGASDRKVGFYLLTPPAPWRGSQLSLFIYGDGAMPRVFGRMVKAGLVGDEREPSVIRLSPVVLYNTFSEVGRAVEILEEALVAEQGGEGSKEDRVERDMVSG